MNETMQTILALALVAAALGYLLWRWRRRRKESPCARGDCGCGKAALQPRRK